MKKWATGFPSVGLKSVNSCGLVWKERGSVVRSRTGSRGTHWSRKKASQPSCLTKALSSWGGGVWLGKVKLCRVKPEEEGVGQLLVTSWDLRGGREPFYCHLVLVVVPLTKKLFSSEAA